MCSIRESRRILNTRRTLQILPTLVEGINTRSDLRPGIWTSCLSFLGSSKMKFWVRDPEGSVLGIVRDRRMVKSRDGGISLPSFTLFTTAVPQSVIFRRRSRFSVRK